MPGRLWRMRGVLWGAILVAGQVMVCHGSDLATELTPWWGCLSGTRGAFAVEGTLRLPARRDGQPRDTVSIRFARYGDDAFDLEAHHHLYAVVLRRRADATALALPLHQRVYVSRGDVDATDHLAPSGRLGRLISPDSAASVVIPALAGDSPHLLAALVERVGAIRRKETERTWGGPGFVMVFRDGGVRLDSTSGVEVDVAIRDPGQPPGFDDFSGLVPEPLSRRELEWTLARGTRRLTEILLPGPSLKAPDRLPREVPHGRLAWEGQHRVVTLWGTPEEVGTAHGELLHREAWRCIDSVLGVVGPVETVRSGRWFRHRLDEAHARLDPHIPRRHARETVAVADAVGCDAAMFASVNVFPELFHCSGFAVSGSATSDGTLFHGRVLDYMTHIGLQDAAAVFVIVPEGHIPFASVGYAGFTGTVSGMNTAGLSVGEMGGGGEGKWDGVPMATLMRRGIEECSTLDDVLALWQSNARTCEYYYVFADAKGRRSVGVAATPDRVETVWPGEDHPRLGPGIPGSVVLSSGDRLEALRRRITAGHGTLDATSAIRLMDRPVAAPSNLHNVLFVPERLELHVAHATHDAVAAEQPAVRLDLSSLVAAVPLATRRASAMPLVEAGSRFPAADSMRPAPDEQPDAAACLAGLVWEPTGFSVELHAADEGRGDFCVRFPSPRASGDLRNDSVWMEWYAVRDRTGEVSRAPGCVVVHESGSRMQFGRLIAKGLREHGIHAFLVHLPHYGRRRDPIAKPGPERLVLAVRQAVADVRRARDALAALPVVDGGRICLQGTSLGGFVATTAAALDRGYAKTFIMLAGADLPSVLANGRRDAAKVRAKLAAAGMSEIQVRDLLHAIEPLRLAHRLPPDRTWLYSGLFDDVVPPHNAGLLADAAGLAASHHVRIAADHYTGIFFLPAILAEVAKQVRTP